MSMKLQGFLDDQGVKHTWFADQCKISSATLHHILKGHYLPNLVTAYEIERHTKFTVTMHDWVADYQKVKKDNEGNDSYEKKQKTRGTKLKEY